MATHIIHVHAFAMTCTLYRVRIPWRVLFHLVHFTLQLFCADPLFLLRMLCVCNFVLNLC